jgi:hypothetical protein
MLRREFPGPTWDPPLRPGRAVDPGQLVTGDGLRVRVQLLDTGEHAAFVPSARECLAAVREAYAAALGWPEPPDPFA